MPLQGKISFFDPRNSRRAPPRPAIPSQTRSRGKKRHGLVLTYAWGKAFEKTFLSGPRTFLDPLFTAAGAVALGLAIVLVLALVAEVGALAGARIAGRTSVTRTSVLVFLGKMGEKPF